MRRFYLIISVAYLLCGSMDSVMADAPHKRIHLSSFRPIWGQKDLEARSHLDVGVEEDFDKRECRILAPIEPKTEEKVWAPLDFYTQVEKNDIGKYKAVLGRPDVFFKGDDHNRNGREDEHVLTRTLADTVRHSLSFVKKEVSKKKDRVEVVIKFVRGKLTFEGLMAVEISRTNKGCVSRLVYCTESVGEGKVRVCKKDRWTKRVLEIRAVADETGFLTDQISWKKLKPNEKNDVHSLVALVVDVDKDPEGEQELLTLATK